MKKTILAAVIGVAASLAGYVATAQAYSCYTTCNTYGNSTQCTRNCY
jgi:hypothetical protein